MLQLNHLNKYYTQESGQQLAAVKDVCLEIGNEHHLISLIGPDGAGKSTLLKLIAGLIEADSGEVKPSSPLSIGYMSQHLGLYEDLSVIENLRLFAKLRDITPPSDKTLWQQLRDLCKEHLPFMGGKDQTSWQTHGGDKHSAHSAISDSSDNLAEADNTIPQNDAELDAYLLGLLTKVGLSKFKDYKAGSLSGGMKQKLALTCAISARPQLLILDEPTVGVDPISRRELWQIIYSYLEQHQSFCIFSSLYLEEAEKSSLTIFMQHGQVIYAGSSQELKSKVADQCFALNLYHHSYQKLARGLICAKALHPESCIIDVCPRLGRIDLLTRAHTSPTQLKSELDSLLKPLLASTALDSSPSTLESIGQGKNKDVAPSTRTATDTQDDISTHDDNCTHVDSVSHTKSGTRAESDTKGSTQGGNSLRLSSRESSAVSLPPDYELTPREPILEDAYINLTYNPEQHIQAQVVDNTPSNAQQTPLSHNENADRTLVSSPETSQDDSASPQQASVYPQESTLLRTNGEFVSHEANASGLANGAQTHHQSAQEVSESKSATSTTSKSNTQEAVIKVNKIKKQFGDFTAVHDSSFNVYKGEIFGLLGPNGAGKTTTFRMICALLNPSAGSILINGLSLQHAKSSVRATIGYVAQKFCLYRKMTLLQNLTYFGTSYGLNGNYLEERIKFLCETFGLTPFQDELAGNLPFGIQRSLSMACALIHKPAILFLDEATSGADPTSRRTLWSLISQLAASGTTIIVTTHFMEEAEYCDRFLIQDQGKILILGTPDEICLQPQEQAEQEQAQTQAQDEDKAKDKDKAKAQEYESNQAHSLESMQDTGFKASLAQTHLKGSKQQGSDQRPLVRISIEEAFIHCVEQQRKTGVVH